MGSNKITVKGTGGKSLVPARAALTKALSVETPYYVSREEVRRVVDGLSAKPHIKAFVRGLWLTGARVSELLAATVGNLNFGARSLTLRTLKRKRPMTRGIPIPSDYLGELAVLVNQRKLGSEDRLFPWSRSRAYEIVRTALLAGGVDRKRSHPHILRHGHAVNAVLAGVPLNIIQRNLGHASITTTSVYLEVTGEDVRSAYEKVEW